MATLNTLSVNLIFGTKILPNPRGVMLDKNGAIFVKVKGGYKSATIKDETTVFVDPSNHAEILKSDLRKATKADFGIPEDKPVEAAKPASKPKDTNKMLEQAALSSVSNSDKSINGFEKQLAKAIASGNEKQISRVKKALATCHSNRTLALLGS